MVSDLELAFGALRDKKAVYDNLFNYYDGLTPLVYSRERLRQIFNEIDARFTQNWCAVVIDSCLERIQLRQFTISDATTEEEDLNGLVEANELTLEADSVHLAAMVTGEAFVFVWKEEDEDYPQAYYNDPRLCHAFYYPDNPRKMRMACKWWTGDDGYVYLNLYYPERIEYYVTQNVLVNNSEISSYKAFVPAALPDAINPYLRIPLFHFRRERRKTRSELANVIEPQDAINKLLSDMMVAAEFGAFRQRYIISNADVTKLKNAPNSIWDLPASDGEGQQTSVGELSTTELTNYTEAVDKWTSTIGIITRTPRHYFMTQGGDPSGEALIAMEAPLNKKCQKYIDRFAVTWRALAHFMLQIQGVDVEETDIAAVFDKPETVQPRTEAEIRKMGVEAGLPLRTILRDDGWTDAELESMDEDKQAETKSVQAGLGAAMLNAQAQFDRGGQNNGAMVAQNGNGE